MAPVLAPGTLVREAVACTVLGALLGAVRALAPAKGRAAFAFDFLLVGALLFLLQSYAAGVSSAGTLRWYMAGGGALGALAAHVLLAGPMQAARRFCLRLVTVPAGFLQKRVLRPALERRRARVQRTKQRRIEKRNAKKQKKSLQKQPHLLYNSNV